MPISIDLFATIFRQTTVNRTAHVYVSNLQEKNLFRKQSDKIK